MKYLSSFQQISRARQLGLFLAGAVLASTLGLPAFLGTASAAGLTDISDTISDSGPSYPSNHVIAYTASSTVTAAQTIKIQFDPAGDAFDISAVVAADVSATGMTVVANVGACGAGGDEVYPTIDSSAPDESVTLTVCATDTVAAGAKTVTIGNNHAINPSSAGSYVIRIAGTQADSADTRVAIVNTVTVTASVDTSLTFTVAGVATGTSVVVNGDWLSTTTSATAIQFGTLAVSASTTAAQDLTVTTNAANGFVVTLKQDQNLTSNTGADIDLFKDGAATAVPTAWTTPLATLGTEATYGHFGITSDDTDLNGGEFTSGGGRKYAGDFNAARQVFSHTAPSDGTTQDIGKARIGFKIQISALQEAAKDYTNRIIYVATPTF
jgi:hypothetical protein